jgi:hypothetical protein
MSFSTGSLAGPCAPARSEVDSRCAEAARLAGEAEAHQQRVREVRRQLTEVNALREADVRARDGRQINERKNEAQSSYHDSIARAADQGEVQLAAYGWLRSIDSINRQAALADSRAEQVTRTAAELEQAVPAVELAADAARIAAEAAEATCLDARRQLAACEEEAQRRMDAGAPRQAGQPSLTPVAGAPFDPSRAPRSISHVLRGDRHALQAVAGRLSEETGVEAGRVQLLLLELREAIAARALEENALGFPSAHPFWGQFPAEEARRVATSLASMGYRFDGHDAWSDGRRPGARDMALSLSHVGIDPRSLRVMPDQSQIQTLWQGTNVLVEDYLAACAPELELNQMIACLGQRAGALSELWDLWGRLRTLLVSPAPGSSAG